MAELQEGIYHRPGKSPGRFFVIAFFRAQRGVPAPAVGAGLEKLWTMWQGLRAGRVRDLSDVPVPAADLTVLIGFGPRAFGLREGGRARPEGLSDDFQFRPPRGGGGGPVVGPHKLEFAEDVRENRAAEDIAVQFIANSKLAVDRAIVETWKLLADDATIPLEFATFYTGFQRDDHRSWIDFYDGISNLRSEDREQVIKIDHRAGPDAWLESGTYLAFLRLEVDIRAWRRLSREEQEVLVGRDKLNGCPLVASDSEFAAQPGCPIAGKEIWESENDPIAEPRPTSDPRLKQAHTHRANQHRPDPSSRESRRIFRQGYEFLEWKESAPGFRLGLNFVSFQDTPDRLFRILTQVGWLGDVNFGGDPNDQPAGMKRLLQVYGAGIYVVPPRTEDEPFPGASIFGLATNVPAVEPAPRTTSQGAAASDGRADPSPVV